jgi:ABC-type lipoprotein release transport system permease subunit
VDAVAVAALTAVLCLAAARIAAGRAAALAPVEALRR